MVSATGPPEASRLTCSRAARFPSASPAGGWLFERPTPCWRAVGCWCPWTARSSPRPPCPRRPETGRVAGPRGCPPASRAIACFSPPPGAAVWDVSALDRLEAEAWLYLRNVAAHCMREYSCVFRVVVRLGVPADAILSSIGEEQAGLLVTATHAHSSWQRLLMGSVTDRACAEPGAGSSCYGRKRFQLPNPRTTYRCEACTAPVMKCP